MRRIVAAAAAAALALTLQPINGADAAPSKNGCDNRTNNT